MLTERQRAHYEAFGFLFFRELFSPDEMAAIGEEADRLWQEDSPASPASNAPIREASTPRNSSKCLPRCRGSLRTTAST